MDSCSVIYRIITQQESKKIYMETHGVCVIFRLKNAHTPGETNKCIKYSFLYSFSINIEIFSCNIQLARRKYKRNACFTLVPRPFIESIHTHSLYMEIVKEIAAGDNFHLACGCCSCFCCC